MAKDYPRQSPAFIALNMTKKKISKPRIQIRIPPNKVEIPEFMDVRKQRRKTKKELKALMA